HAHARVEPEHLVLCAGTSEAYSWLFKLLCDPGDQVLLPAPSYPLLDDLADLEDVELVRYPLRYDGAWHADPDRIERAIGPRTRAVVIVQPNNPTGSCLTHGELEALGSLCERRGLALISDEVFLDYPFASEPLPSALDAASGLRFVLGGLSKAAGLPQMKASWIAVAGPPTQRDEALLRLETIADTFLSVNTPVQVGLPALLAAGRVVRRAILDRVRTNRSTILSMRKQAAPWDCLAADGGWYAVLRVPRVHTDEDWCLSLLEQEGVHVHPGYFYDFETDGFLVVSLLPPPDQLREGMTRIARRLDTSS
ncbi:MAG: pyridoxal phosphate-dependent aminotransferase, partial [Candidatus Eisenbacteria bacterium]|nr:pyridoxal phosphate-dependent aminotransferase [Candidatus Eisenbacteria bacterium]